eukprot:361625-Chlamydomonas_euryale.AAC.7
MPRRPPARPPPSRPAPSRLARRSGCDAPRLTPKTACVCGSRAAIDPAHSRRARRSAVRRHAHGGQRCGDTRTRPAGCNSPTCSSLREGGGGGGGKLRHPISPRLPI